MRPQPSTIQDHRSRRGVTLVEMLVTLAVLLIMMTAIVQIFQAATGTLSASRAYQEIDAGLRRLDGLMRSDFNGATRQDDATEQPQGQSRLLRVRRERIRRPSGEDSDDYVRFTTKAPVDRPFIGRYWPNSIPLTNTTNAPPYNNPISITSQYAEVIYSCGTGIFTAVSCSSCPNGKNQPGRYNRTQITLSIFSRIFWVGPLSVGRG